MKHDRLTMKMKIHHKEAQKYKLMDAPDLGLVKRLAQESAKRHDHLCPRQILGVRLGLAGLQALALPLNGTSQQFENKDKRLLTFVETDGCGCDGIAIVTGCSVGHRTLRVVDYGKVAATLVDTFTKKAVRVAPSPFSRELAQHYAREAPSRWHAYLEAYQIMPDSQLLKIQQVRIKQSVSEIVSDPEARAICEKCGEEVINEREVLLNSVILCLDCAGESYYTIG
jgi:formylmethanofuran dehydrogenase subunit E